MTGTYVVCLPGSARIQTRALGTTGAAGGESPRGGWSTDGREGGSGGEPPKSTSAPQPSSRR